MNKALFNRVNTFLRQIRVEHSDLDMRREADFILSDMGVHEMMVEFAGYTIRLAAKHEIDEYMHCNNKIQAIKLLREETGLGLKESKQVINNYKP